MVQLAASGIAGSNIPAAPPPTFFMDEFTLASDLDGWIESSARQYFTHHRTRQEARGLQVGHDNRMATDLYSHSRPEYPYTRAFSAYSALVQLYARSGQLPTALVDSQRTKDTPTSPACRYGCPAIESDFHVFTECRRFEVYRAEAGLELRKRIERRLSRTALPENAKLELLRVSQSFFTDDAIWPLGFPHYYLGHVPVLRSFVPLDSFATALEHSSCVTACESDWHFAGFRLAGRIWGTVSSEMAQRFRDN